jgi:hypothetical protein
MLRPPYLLGLETSEVASHGHPGVHKRRIVTKVLAAYRRGGPADQRPNGRLRSEVLVVSSREAESQRVTARAPGFAMTDHGAGWGTFDVTFDVSVDATTEATLAVRGHSAKDGSVQALRDAPLTPLP